MLHPMCFPVSLGLRMTCTVQCHSPTFVCAETNVFRTALWFWFVGVSCLGASVSRCEEARTYVKGQRVV